MQISNQEQYHSFLAQQQQLAKANVKARGRSGNGSLFGNLNSKHLKPHQSLSNNPHRVGMANTKSRQNTMTAMKLSHSSLKDIERQTMLKAHQNVSSELNRNFFQNQKSAVFKDQSRFLKNKAEKSKSRNRNLAMITQQPIYETQAPAGIANLQQKIINHQNSHEQLKFEEQGQMSAHQMKKRLARSRNPAMRQSLSQNTAPEGDGNDQLTVNSSQRPQGPTGLGNQYQNMLIGDCSLAQLTSLQDDSSSMQRLNDNLQDLNSSQFGSNQKLGPNQLNSVANSNLPQRIAPQNFFGAANEGAYNGGEESVNKLNNMINMAKGRNIRTQHKTQGMSSSIPMKNIGSTENQSSIGEMSSVTIGLPSVASQGGPAMLHVLSNQQSSNINLNMNVNLNIQDQSAETQNILHQIQQSQKSEQVKQQYSHQKRHQQRNQNMAQKSDQQNTQNSDLAISQHDNSKIQQLLSVQKSNANSLKSIKKDQQQSHIQVKNIYNNLQNLNFTEQQRKVPLLNKGHQKSQTKISNFNHNYRSLNNQSSQNQRRLIPLKNKNTNQSMAIPQNYLTKQANPAQVALFGKKNFRLQNLKSRQPRNLRSKTIPLNLKQEQQMPAVSSHANSTENIRPQPGHTKSGQLISEPEVLGDHITIQNQQTQPNYQTIDDKAGKNNIETDDNRQQPVTSTAIQYFTNLRQTLQPKKSEKSNFSMPSKQLNQMIVKQIRIQQQNQQQRPLKIKAINVNKVHQDFQKKQIGHDTTNSFQSSSQMTSMQNETLSSKKLNQRNRSSSKSSTRQVGEKIYDESASRNCLASAANMSLSLKDDTTSRLAAGQQKKFESANPYDLNTKPQARQKSLSNAKIQIDKNQEQQKQVKLVSEQKAMAADVLGRLMHTEYSETEKKDETTEEFTFDKKENKLKGMKKEQEQATACVVPKSIQISNIEEQKSPRIENEKLSMAFDSNQQIKSSGREANNSSQAPQSATGSQQIKSMLKRGSTTRINRKEDVGQVRTGIIDFNQFNSNSFDDSSCSHTNERLDALESGQFETNLDLQLDSAMTNLRLNCENTELELEPIMIGDQQHFQEARERAVEYSQRQSRDSQVLFEQKSVRNDFGESQRYSSDNEAPLMIHTHHDHITRELGDDQDSRDDFIGLNRFDEQLQTAIVLQSGSTSSREQSSQLQAEDTDRSRYVRRQTPAFKDKQRQTETDPQSGTGDRKDLRTVIQTQNAPSRWSQQHPMSTLSRKSRVDEQGESIADFERQFGITQTVEKCSQEITDQWNHGSEIDSRTSGSHTHQPRSMQPFGRLQSALPSDHRELRNPRLEKKSRTIAASSQFESKANHENKSLEQRLKEEGLFGANAQSLRHYNTRGSASRDKWNPENPLLESKDTIVSKQRVRQVPVSNAPKRLRNISSSTKKQGRDESRYNSDKKSSKNLSIKQDSIKKNVYHIFGKQTSDSFVSAKERSVVNDPDADDQGTSGQPTTLKVPAANVSDSQKKQRKLLFDLGRKQDTDGGRYRTDLHSKHTMPDGHYRSDLHTKHTLQMQPSVQSFGKQNKQALESSHYKGHHRGQVNSEQQYRTQDELPRKRLYQKDMSIHQPESYQIFDEYGNDHNSKYVKIRMRSPSENVLRRSSSQVSIIESDEERYATNQHTHSYRRKPRKCQQQSAEDGFIYLQQHNVQNSGQTPITTSAQKFQSVLDIDDINQGVVYDRNGRGRKTIGFDETERLSFLQQSRTLSPSRREHDGRSETAFVHPNRRHRHQAQELQHYSLRREIPTSQSHQYRGQKMADGSNHQPDGRQRRVKKPRNIYALHNQDDINQLIEDSEEQIQLISYNPDSSALRYGQHHRQQFYADSDSYEHVDPNSYLNHSPVNPRLTNHRVTNFITIPQKVRTTIFQDPHQQSSSKRRRERDSNEPGKHVIGSRQKLRNWMLSTSQDRARTINIDDKQRQSFTKNRLNREANASQEMICHDNMMIIQSPRGTQSKKRVGTELVQDMRKIHRGRFRQAAPNAGGKLRRVAMSQDPAIGGQSTYSLDQQRKNGHAENLAAWCCLQSKSGKSRAGSCESTGGALRPDNISDNASSGCSVF